MLLDNLGNKTPILRLARFLHDVMSLQIAGLIVITLSALPPSASAQEAHARSREEQHAVGEMIARCSEDQRQFFASGLSRNQYLLFCNCYVHSALDAVDPDEQAYRRQHDEPSPKFVETSRALVTACTEQARLRVPQ